MKAKNIILSLVTLLAINGSQAQQLATNTNSSSNQEIRSTDKKLSKSNFLSTDNKFKFNARMQNLYTNSSTLDASNKLVSGSTKHSMMIRRARLKFTGSPYKNFEFKMELGISNRDLGSPIPQVNNASNVVLDGFVKWKFAPHFKLLVGQSKLPGNVERVISSQKLQFVDRSLLNSKYNIDRDLGIQLHHDWKINKMVLKEKLSLSQGEGRNLVTGNVGGFDYTGRLEILPFGLFTAKGDYFGSDLKREAKPKLMIGFTYDYNDRATRANGNTKSFLTTTQSLSTQFIDLTFKYKGFSVMAEYANKAAQNTSIVSIDSLGNPTKYFYTGMGLNLQAGYLFKNNVELAARYTTIKPSAENKINDFSMYTLGLSKYIKGHNLKIQTDVSITETANKNTSNLLYRLQFEFGF